MKISTKHTIKKVVRGEKLIFSNQLSTPPSHMPGLLLQRTTRPTTGLFINKWLWKLRYFKRLSPFLLAAIFLPVLFLYWISNEENLYQKFILWFAFLFVEVNLAYLDLVLWKYYHRKKLFRIWMIELVCLSAACYFIL